LVSISGISIESQHLLVAQTVEIVCGGEGSIEGYHTVGVGGGSHTVYMYAAEVDVVGPEMAMVVDPSGHAPLADMIPTTVLITGEN
jgi:hypothetical protein